MRQAISGSAIRRFCSTGLVHGFAGWVICLSLFSPSAWSGSSPTHSDQLDQLVEHTLQAMLIGDWKSSTHSAQQLVTQFPDYALGHYMLAEGHQVLAGNQPFISDESRYSHQLMDLLLEARARHEQINSRLQFDADKTPAEMIQVGNHIDHVIISDLETSVLYFYDTRGTTPTLVKQHYISSGKAGYDKRHEGDLKSPMGVYRIHGFRSDDSLPPLYGSGALMLNYPNTLDRSLGRTGSGIWLHGNPRIDRSRSPRSSEGCITMANDHLLDLYHSIQLDRTHVILTDRIEWQNRKTTAEVKERYRALFDRYRHAWIQNKLSDLSTIYSPDAMPVEVRAHAGAGATKVAMNYQKDSTVLPKGLNLQQLSLVDREKISILRNPKSDNEQLPDHLVMEFSLPDRSALITLYWQQTATGSWEIKREKVQAEGA